MNIILGSSSKWRRAIFAHVAPEFESMSPDIDEQAIRDDDPFALTRKIAQAKADALLSKINEPTLLVTADQVVVLNGQILEKPRDEKEARTFLRSYSHQVVEVVNAVVVVNTSTNIRAEGNDVVRITFGQLPDDLIEELIKEGEVFHCAGGLQAEHPAVQAHMISMEGTVESLQGVPIELTKELIEEVQ